jgi:hypothetical protein
MLPRERRPLTDGCCQGGHTRTSPKTRRGWEIVAGAFSFGVWAMMPKCPVCVATYVALWTGLGLSFATAAYLRWSLLFLSAVLLVYFVLKRTVRAWTGLPGRMRLKNSTRPAGQAVGSHSKGCGRIAAISKALL